MAANTPTMKRLATARRYRGIFLTEAGVVMATVSRRRHRLVVNLLGITAIRGSGSTGADAADIAFQGSMIGADRFVFQRHCCQEIHFRQFLQMPN
jgi:hypothetical protein